MYPAPPMAVKTPALKLAIAEVPVASVPTRLPKTLSPVEPFRNEMPFWPFPETRFPRMVWPFENDPSTSTPSNVFGSATMPDRSVPT